MANQGKNYKNNNNRKTSTKNSNLKRNENKNVTIMKTLVVLGVIVLGFAIVYLMNYLSKLICR